jgi:NAD(P)H dehydrogenase (quinone)
MAEVHPILVTGAGGGIGGVGRRVVGHLSAQRIPVRAFVHRDDDRAAALRAMDGVDVVVGDLTRGHDVVAAINGCRRLYFGMSVSPDYLEATATVAAAALDSGSVELLVNMSQMTVSQMYLTSVTESRQQRLHWLAEHVLNWSGLAVTHLRPTVFMENPFFDMLAAASDVVTHLLTDDPARHVGRVYELTGAASRDMNAIAAEFAEVLRRPVAYADVPFDQWLEHDLKPLGLDPHLRDHLATMARLHRQNRYDRTTSGIADLLGRPPSGIDSLVDETPAMQAAAGPR